MAQSNQAATETIHITGTVIAASNTTVSIYGDPTGANPSNPNTLPTNAVLLATVPVAVTGTTQSFPSGPLDFTTTIPATTVYQGFFLQRAGFTSGINVPQNGTNGGLFGVSTATETTTINTVNPNKEDDDKQPKNNDDKNDDKKAKSDDQQNKDDKQAQKNDDHKDDKGGVVQPPAPPPVVIPAAAVSLHDLTPAWLQAAMSPSKSGGSSGSSSDQPQNLSMAMHNNDTPSHSIIAHQ